MDAAIESVLPICKPLAVKVAFFSLYYAYVSIHAYTLHNLLLLPFHGAIIHTCVHALLQSHILFLLTKIENLSQSSRDMKTTINLITSDIKLQFLRLVFVMRW